MQSAGMGLAESNMTFKNIRMRMKGRRTKQKK